MALTPILAEQSIAFADNGDGSGMYAALVEVQIVDGETYQVKWDGLEYTNTAILFDESVVAMGNLAFLGTGDDTGEPFCMIGGEGEMAIATLSNAESHTIGIYQEVAVEEPEGEHTGNVLATLFQDQANAIREGLGPIGTFAPATFAAKIREINKLIGTGGSSDDVRYVTFMSEDGSEELCVKTVANGDDCADTADLVDRGFMETPTKESTAQYNYVHVGWATEPNGALDANALADVIADRTVYANFAAVTRMYTVRFYDGEELKNTVQVPYGGTAEYEITATGKYFTGWVPSNSNITEDTDCYAQFTDDATFLGYGVEWDYSQPSSTLTRIGIASSFSDPVPATTLTETGSSPFDSVMPWAGMKKYNIINGAVSYSEDDEGFSMTDYDTVVYIPRFYYAAVKDTTNSKWRWAISPTAKDGFTLHPGSGRYVGRYHTSGSSSAVYSKSGVQPFGTNKRALHRTYCHNKGAKWWMLDLATWSALQLLYLIEFADFNSQGKLGNGNGTSSQVLGGTDAAVYHTYNGGAETNQYRWVEHPWGRSENWVDGIFLTGRKCYIGTDNGTFTDSTSGLTDSGVTCPSSGFITGFAYCDSFPWAFLPDTASGGSEKTYVTDYIYTNTSDCAVFTGGAFVADRTVYGMFQFGGDARISQTSYTDSTRLIYIP